MNPDDVELYQFMGKDSELFFWLFLLAHITDRADSIKMSTSILSFSQLCY